MTEYQSPGYSFKARHFLPSRELLIQGKPFYGYLISVAPSFVGVDLTRYLTSLGFIFLRIFIGLIRLNPEIIAPLLLLTGLYILVSTEKHSFVIL